MSNRSTHFIKPKMMQFLQGLLITPAIAAAIVGLALQFGPPALAITIVPACAKTGLPDLNCAVTAFVNVARLIFSVTGSFALLMFIIGGFKILSSAGNDKKVSEGKEYIKNAVIGIFIILTAAYVIEYGYQRLTGVEASCKDGVMFNRITTDEKGNSKSVPECCHTSRLPPPGSPPGTKAPPSQVLYMNAKGVQECISNCSQITTHSCQIITNRPNGAEGCIVGICPGAAENQCCPKI